MPQIQTLDLSPVPREKTPLENTLSAFSNRLNENRKSQNESDALEKIYKKYQNEGKDIGDFITNINKSVDISPTQKVNTVNQFIELQKINATLQKETTKQLQAERKAKTASQDKIAKEEKEAKDKENLISGIENARGKKPGELAGFKSNPTLAEVVTRPPKEGKVNQADRGLDEEQLKRIEHTMKQPGFKELTPDEQNVQFLMNKVSKENAKAIIEPRIEQIKKADERHSILRKEQAKADIGFAEEQVSKIPLITSKQRVFQDVNDLNETGVTGSLWDQAMNKAGLLQYTSDGYRVFTSLAKDVIKNTNIKDIIGSQITAGEFKFFTDATVNPGFTKEANRQIIKKDQLALRYEKLYSDITKSLIEQNNGQIPERIQSKVNDEFMKQSEKLNKELKQIEADYDFIQNVPPGKVLMFDKKRRPLHAPANEVEKYIKLKATLS